MPSKITSFTPQNPFHHLLANLSLTEYQTVTIAYLREVSKILNKPGTIVQTFGEAFQVLEFLAQAQAVELIEVEGFEGVYKIRKLM